MRDATDDGAPIEPNCPGRMLSGVDFDPAAPPRKAWSIAFGSEHQEPSGGVQRSSRPISVFWGWVIVSVSFAALAWIALNPAARYELVRWVTFHHARQTYEILYSIIGARIRS
jgi:hypothetical protein